MFNEVRGTRKLATHVGLVFLDGANLTQEEIRSVPSIVQRRTTDVKIFVVLIGNTLVDEVLHLTDTIVLPNIELSNYSRHLLMAMCNLCPEDWIPFEHKRSNDILSCYLLQIKGVNSAMSHCNNMYNGMLGVIETAEEMIFLQQTLIKETKAYKSGGIQINVGLQRDLKSRTNRFLWATSPGRYRPLVIYHWLPGNPSRARFSNSTDCALWQFTVKMGVSRDRTPVKDEVDEGWIDVVCYSQLDLLALCEIALPQVIHDSALISVAAAPEESVNLALLKGNYLVFQGNVVSVSAHLANQEFIQFLIASNKDIPIFDCGEGAGDRRHISYFLVCDFVKHCSNGRDELSCFDERETPGADTHYYSTVQRPLVSQYACDNGKDCIHGDDEVHCTDRDCNTLRCSDGSCCSLSLNDDDFIYFIYKDSSSNLIVNGSSSFVDTHMSDRRCTLLCNRHICIEESLFRDGAINCTGPEGSLYNSLGKVEPANNRRFTFRHLVRAPVCHYIKGRYGDVIGCRDMSHLRDCQNAQCDEGYVKCPNSYCIPQHYLRDGKADCPTGEDENPFYIQPCVGNFVCWNSEICLHPDLVCNGHLDCPDGDDDFDCHDKCPEGLRCIAGSVTVLYYSRSVPINSLSAIDRRTRYLDLSGVAFHGVEELLFETIDTFLNLQVVILSKCNIRQLYLPKTDIYARNASQIMKLDISYNMIEEIFVNDSYVYYYKNINYLNVSSNRHLASVKHLNFNFLEILDLSYTGISSLNESVFARLPELKYLNLSHTLISDFSRNYFLVNSTLRSLDLRDVLISDAQYYFFYNLTITETLFTDHYQNCCPHIEGLTIEQNKCIAQADAFSSCSQLLRLDVQRVILWIVAVLAVLGNTAVIVYRLICDRSVLKTGYGLFVTNLGVSDFIMGVYLFIIAGADTFYGDDYVRNDTHWRHSVVCKCAGFLACLSCEASTFFVFMITIDRFLVMKFPFGQIRFSRLSKTIVVIISWVTSFLLSLVPIVFNYSIYSSNAMCLGLPLTNTNAKGQGYAFGMFIIYNLIMFIFIACGQYAIFRAMTGNIISNKATSMSCSRRGEEKTVAKRLSLIVLSNFLIWFPVGLMGLLSLGGHEVSNEVYAWKTVLLLPINSAANPVLYTIPALMVRWKKFTQKDERTVSTSL